VGSDESASKLEIDSVSVRFGGLRALDQVSIDAAPGRIIGVIGPNGAGKTTLFNVVCGFVRPDAGTLRWRGRSLAGVPPHQLARLGIARTLQGVRLFPRLSAVENVMVGGGHLHRPWFVSTLLGLPRSDRAERALRAAALEALDQAGVAGVAERMAGGLPYAIQKRVGLARALVARPSLLLLDEPAGGLGADEVAGVAELIRRLRGSITVMLVEHRMDLVMSVCDDVAVLDAGALIARGTPGQVQADPRVLSAYLGDRTDEPARERKSADSPPESAPTGSPRKGRRQRTAVEGKSAALEVEDLVATYGPVRAVDRVSLNVDSGSITAVLGANGAGKTSLLRTVSGLLAPRGGRVSYGGKDITGLPAEEVVRRGLGHVPEGAGAIAELTVDENLRLGSLWRRDRRDRAVALEEVYDLFPRLRERRKQFASSLSGGERQMLSIGRALMGRPQMLLLDEPSLGLAPLVTEQIMGLISGLSERSGLTVLLVEQNADSALSIADHGVVLNVGRVVAAADAVTLAGDEQLRHAYLGLPSAQDSE